MDITAIDVTTLAHTVAPYVIAAAPYLRNLSRVAGEEAVKEISKDATKKLGEGSWGLAKSIWQKLSGTKPETQAALDSALSDIADDPDDTDTHAALRVKLRKVLKEDPSLAEELARLIREAKSTNIEGDRNVTFGDNASNNVVTTGDGNVVGDGNINIVNKRP